MWSLRSRLVRRSAVPDERRSVSDHHRMREDWNERAREDARYYVAFGRREQDDAEFAATGARLVQALEQELKRLPAGNPRARRALEIGCGPGRLMAPLAPNFGEIHGIDVSDEMVGLARERLRGIPNAHVHATDGASLAAFADESFDFVYSYAVFQHIPRREVISEYMRETRRVLRPGGIFRGQFNGLPPLETEEYDTWAGCRFSGDDIRNFTRENELDLLELSGTGTQYMWTTWRRRVRGNARGPAVAARVRRVTNAFSSEPLAPASGRFAAVSLWMENLPAECELNRLEAFVAGMPATAFYLGPASYDGLQQLNVMLPAGVATGLQPIELYWNGEPVARATVRVVPPGPRVPRITALNDAVNLLSTTRISSGLVKVVTEEMIEPELFGATLDDVPVRDVQWFCTDPLPPRYEFNLRLPEGVNAGTHMLHLHYGKRRFAPVEIEVG